MIEELMIIIENFINSLDFIPDKYEVEKNIYNEKIELIFNKKSLENDGVFGMEVGFYSNEIIDVIIINWNGDIIKSKQLTGAFNETLPVLKDIIIKNIT